MAFTDRFPDMGPTWGRLSQQRARRTMKSTIGLLLASLGKVRLAGCKV